MAEMRVNSELDLENLAEEVESLGRSQESALVSALTHVIAHLLKLEHSPAPAPRNKWMLRVVEQRGRAVYALEDSGTLARKAPDLLPKAWKQGHRLAVKAPELFDGVAPEALPTDCPYSLAQILDDDFIPANRHGLG